MQHLDAREWLEAERLAGNPFAEELLILIALEPENIETAEVFDDLAKLVPDTDDKWRIVEEIKRRFQVLDDITELLRNHASDVRAPNGMPHTDEADWLHEVFNSSRWLDYDL